MSIGVADVEPTIPTIVAGADVVADIASADVATVVAGADLVADIASVAVAANIASVDVVANITGADVAADIAGADVVADTAGANVVADIAGADVIVDAASGPDTSSMYQSSDSSFLQTASHQPDQSRQKEITLTPVGPLLLFDVLRASSRPEKRGVNLPAGLSSARESKTYRHIARVRCLTRFPK